MWRRPGFFLVLALAATVPPRIGGHRRACRHDFRATPDRCPECGMIPAR